MHKGRIVVVVATALTLVLAAACASSGAAPQAIAVTSSSSSPEELAAFEKARPVFEHHCVKCHASFGAMPSAKAMAHVDMTTYPFGGHHTADVTSAIRDALGATPGVEASMPPYKPGLVTGAELQAILDWAAAFDRSHAPAPAP